MESKKLIEKLDFRRSDLFIEVLSDYHSLCKETIDTLDFVPPKHNKKILKVFWREFRRNVRQAKRLYRFEKYKEWVTARQEKARARKEKKINQASALTPELLAQLAELTKKG